jgi:hypothetical protein
MASGAVLYAHVYICVVVVCDVAQCGAVCVRV